MACSPGVLHYEALGLPITAQAAEFLAATRQALADNDPRRVGSGPRTQARRRQVIQAFRALRSLMQPRPMSTQVAMGISVGCLALAGGVYAFTQVVSRLLISLLAAAIVGVPVLLIKERTEAERRLVAFEGEALELEALYLAQASDLPEGVDDAKPPRLARALLQRIAGKSKAFELVRLPRGAGLPATVSLAAMGTRERSLTLELVTRLDDETEPFGRIVVELPRPLSEADVVVVEARIDTDGDVEVRASEPHGAANLHASIEYEAPLPVARR